MFKHLRNICDRSGSDHVVALCSRLLPATQSELPENRMEVNVLSGGSCDAPTCIPGSHMQMWMEWAQEQTRQGPLEGVNLMQLPVYESRTAVMRPRGSMKKHTMQAGGTVQPACFAALHVSGLSVGECTFDILGMGRCMLARNRQHICCGVY